MTIEEFLPAFLIIAAIGVGFIGLQVTLFYRRQNALKTYSQNIGFAPVKASEELMRRIQTLYDLQGDRNVYEMQNVAYRSMPDCEVFIFDLIETSGGENDVKERSAIAILSPTLKLPHFIFIPKVNKLLTEIVKRGLSHWGKLLDFSHSPALDNRYMIFSRDPEKAQSFINETLTDIFAKTRAYTLYASGDIFTFSEFRESYTLINPEELKFRLEYALFLFHKMQE